jgi:hypothetical protein
VVQRLSERRADGNRVYVCVCDCGSQTEVIASSLRDRRRPTESCGCLSRERSAREITAGTRFGWLAVVERLDKRKHGLVLYLCRCDCGDLSQVTSRALRSGRTQSCGCRRGSWTHGGNSHPLFKTWTGMHARCYNSSHIAYGRYGGRGITVCDRWHDFWPFVEDMGDKPGPGYTLDRVDNDGNYEPGNCRWATWSQQRRNQRPRRNASHPLTDDATPVVEAT